MSNPEKYREIIQIIEKAGGPKLPNYRSLASKEKHRIVFNTWAFLFGIFYYVYIGCWKKGIVYLTISIVLMIIVDNLFPTLTNISWVIGPVIFAVKANTDIYKKYVLNENSWI